MPHHIVYVELPLVEYNTNVQSVVKNKIGLPKRESDFNSRKHIESFGYFITAPKLKLYALVKTKYNGRVNA